MVVLSRPTDVWLFEPPQERAAPSKYALQVLRRDIEFDADELGYLANQALPRAYLYRLTHLPTLRRYFDPEVCVYDVAPCLPILPHCPSSSLPG